MYSCCFPRGDFPNKIGTKKIGQTMWSLGPGSAITLLICGATVAFCRVNSSNRISQFGWNELFCERLSLLLLSFASYCLSSWCESFGFYPASNPLNAVKTRNSFLSTFINDFHFCHLGGHMIYRAAVQINSAWSFTTKVKFLKRTSF